eukprot:c7863_g1_i1.p1 GENE.c7863_g1_i1~~c7863_g1_i1.p1  ORF type:complete len:656 (+),score=149.23 c7863_g1_i1:219-1970(+)
MGDTQFSFRIPSPSVPHHPNHLYSTFGTVYFRQQRDPSIPRGYFQKSVVLLSTFPFIALFHKILSIVAPLFFEFGNQSIERACLDITTWPSPQFNSLMEQLPLVGSILKTYISFPLFTRTPRTRPRKRSGHRDLVSTNGSPSTATTQPTTPTEEQAIKSLSLQEALEMQQHMAPGLFQEARLFTTFQHILSDLWHIWELSLTGRSMLVTCPTASECSEAVEAIVSLISPIAYAGDYRPYFTIHDKEFREFTTPNTGSKKKSKNKDQTKATNATPATSNASSSLVTASVGRDDDLSVNGVILGVTNPFFLKVASTWPCVISVTQFTPPSSDRSRGRKADDIAKECFMHCNYKPLVMPSKQTLRILMTDSLTEANVDINNAVLRRHFTALMKEFVIPFEHYFAWISSRDSTLYSSPPKLPTFDEEGFLLRVRNIGASELPVLLSVVGTNSVLAELYRRFIHSIHFEPWFRSRREAAVRELQEAACARSNIPQDLCPLLQSTREVQLLDMFLQVRAQMEKIQQQSRPNQQLLAKLQRRVQKILLLLPEPIQKNLQSQQPHLFEESGVVVDDVSDVSDDLQQTRIDD